MTNNSDLLRRQIEAPWRDRNSERTRMLHSLAMAAALPSSTARRHVLSVADPEIQSQTCKVDEARRLVLQGAHEGAQ